MSLFAKLGDFMTMSRRPQGASREAAQPETAARQIADLQRALGRANRAPVRDEALIGRLGEQLERLL